MFKYLASFLFLFGVFNFSVPTLAQNLQEGGQAVVFVTDPTGLRVRAGAGINHEALGNLFTGELVDIIGGPQSANGYVWWNIRTSSGLEGWSVEGADGLKTLTPLQTAKYEPELVVSAVVNIDYIPNLAFSPDNTRVAIGHFYGGGASIYDIQNDQLLVELEGGMPEILRWSVEGDYIELNDNMAELTDNRSSDMRFIYAVSTWEEVTDQNIIDAIEWVNYPYEVRSLSECFSGGSNKDQLFIQSDNGTLYGGQAAYFEDVNRNNLLLGNGEGGVLWNTDSTIAVIWSKITLTDMQSDVDENGNSMYAQGFAEVWDLAEGELLLRLTHGLTNLGICASESAAPFLSTDGQYIATISGGNVAAIINIWKIPTAETTNK